LVGPGHHHTQSLKLGFKKGDLEVGKKSLIRQVTKEKNGSSLDLSRRPDILARSIGLCDMAKDVCR